VQLPLHEPYFDFTLISVAHRKNPIKTSKSFTFTYLKQKSKLIAPTPFSMRRVVSTSPRSYSPCHGDSRLLAITYSCSRISGYNPYPFFSYFLRLAKIRIFASLWLGLCGTSIAHNIEAMMTCLCPFYHIYYEQLYNIIIF
jgi:hypothetical protein